MVQTTIYLLTKVNDPYETLLAQSHSTGKRIQLGRFMYGKETTHHTINYWPSKLISQQPELNKNCVEQKPRRGLNKQKITTDDMQLKSWVICHQAIMFTSLIIKRTQWSQPRHLTLVPITSKPTVTQLSEETDSRSVQILKK